MMRDSRHQARKLIIPKPQSNLETTVPARYEPQGSLPVILRELCQTATLEGAAIIDRSQPNEPVTYTAGRAGADTIDTGRALLAASPAGPSHGLGADRRPVLACPWTSRPSRLGGIVMWRAPKAAPWTQADHSMA
ncbi:MAG TPA: hypothetical protein VHB27_03875, partial [Rhodopila sp.]|uniref:hypothetical protein n=1 Tax=Rhodopila sp. TaxID=2480087 RepID=UPI002C1787BC